MLRSDPGVEVVGECSDGPEAVRLAERLRPDVVLMDVEMPGGDGITGTAELRDRVPEAGVLVLTTFDVDEYVLGARAGAAGVLLNPTPPRGLIDAVLECASGGAALGPTVVERLVASYVARPGPESVPGLVDLTAMQREVARRHGRGSVERRDRSRALARRDHRQDPRRPDPGQAGGARPVQAVVLAHRGGVVD